MADSDIDFWSPCGSTHMRSWYRQATSRTRRRHALFFLEFSEQYERAVNVGGPQRTAAAAAVLHEYPNLRIALGWCVESVEAQLGLRLARAVQYLWAARGFLSEGLAWLERLLALPGADAPTPERAVCLLAAGNLAIELGNPEGARSFYEVGLPMARTMADPWVQSLGPQNFGVYHARCGDLETSRQYLQEALTIARANNDGIDEAISLGTLSVLAWYQGDYAQAQVLALDARAVAHASGEDWAESFAVLRLGMLKLLRGDYAGAKLELELAQSMMRTHGDPNHTAYTLEGLGRVAIATGDNGRHTRIWLKLFGSSTNLGAG